MLQHPSSSPPHSLSPVPSSATSQAFPRTLPSKSSPASPAATHPAPLCLTQSQDTETGAGSVRLPLTLQQQQQQQQNRICFANELAEQLLDVSAPSQRQVVHLVPCCSSTTKPQDGFCSAHAPAKGNLHLKGWGGTVWGFAPQIPAFASSPLPSHKALQLKGSQIRAVFNITAENERHYQGNCRVMKPGSDTRKGELGEAQIELSTPCHQCSTNPLSQASHTAPQIPQHIPGSCWPGQAAQGVTQSEHLETKWNVSPKAAEIRVDFFSSPLLWDFQHSPAALLQRGMEPGLGSSWSRTALLSPAQGSAQPLQQPEKGRGHSPMEQLVWQPGRGVILSPALL